MQVAMDGKRLVKYMDFKIKIQDRAIWAVNGKVEILPMMYLALSYDHRLIDGKESVGFLVTIKELLEDPARLLLDI
ncbi:2-oxo acid dehydrogenase subunit E2 [Thalassotalea fonticola]|uniref:2-oxo acid dehydrogenase subunit E2 n=1 Tax=Thalassotalea fonticola TaxID=3065649 RepID=UPI003865140F